MKNKIDNDFTDEEFEISRPRSAGKLYNYFMNYKFTKAVKMLPFSIENLKVLDLCCGSGMMSEYYAGNRAAVTGVDLSQKAIERAKIRKERFKFVAEFNVADVTNLPFQDNSFDIVSVHDGLHHIENPKKAIKEMVRVSKKGIIIIEPARAFITRVSVLFGISTDYEGEDFVYRFKKKEINRWLQEYGIKNTLIKRYIMFYPHRPGRVFKFLDCPVLFNIVRIKFYLLNILFGRFGNKIQIVGFK